MLHIGADRVVRRRDILAVLDRTKPSSPDTEAFLDAVKKRGRFFPFDGARSVVIDTIDGDVCAYETPVSADTIKKRGASANAFV